MQRALACNPSTPHDVLQRLWEMHPECVLEFHHLEIGARGSGNPASVLHHPRPVEDAMRAGFCE